MNTRIQVEHPVSELVTGVDLIQEMIRVAAGEKLSMGGRQMKLSGHAIECRINAENPDKNFAPCPGTIKYLLPPWGKGIRWDSHVTSGDIISPHYDSLIGKLIVYDETREKCIERTRQALDGMILAGIKTTIPICRALLNDKNFIEGNVHTKYLEDEFLV
jgi:acetyl-CoA carboxylase biotin carboxylase subunit